MVALDARLVVGQAGLGCLTGGWADWFKVGFGCSTGRLRLA